MADAAKIAQQVVSGVSSLGGMLIGPLMQKRENQRQRDYETQMYERATQDNLDFWNMSNMYNSPEQQMQRLKQAGLNPNLVYGNGANAQVDTLKGQSPNTSNSTNVQAPDFSALQNSISSIADLKVKDAQANLLNQQAETQKSNRQLNAVTTELKRLESIRQRTTNEYERRSLETRIKSLELLNDKYITEMANTRSQTRKTDTDRQISVESNNRARQLHPTNKLLQIAELANKQASTDSIRATTKNTLSQTEKLKVDKFISEIDAIMKAQGISPNSSGVSRILDRVMSGLTNSSNISDVLQKAKQAIKELNIK